MADNSNKNPFQKNQKQPNQNKPDDNFDWSKVIKMVFGWGAVIVAAVIVMQLMRTGAENYTDISFAEYKKLIDAPESILSAKVVKSDIND